MGSESLGSELNTLIGDLVRGNISDKGFQILVDHYGRQCAKKYAMVPEGTRDDLLDENFIAMTNSPVTNKGGDVNFKAYFEMALSRKFADYFRKQPDGILYRRIKGLLQTPAFRRTGPAHHAAKISWEMAFWQPASWPLDAIKARQQDLDELQHHAVSFCEAGIEITTRKDTSVLVRDGSLAAYMLYLFGLTAEHLGAPMALRAADLKEIICHQLWIAPRDCASNESKETDEEGQEIPSEVDRLGCMIPDPYAVLDLERRLVRAVRDEKTVLHMWLLYKRAIDPAVGTPRLETEIKTFTNLPAVGHETLNKRLHELPGILATNGIELDFEGANDVVAHVLGRFFGRFRRAANAETGPAA